MISAPQNINGMIGILSGGASDGSTGAVSSPFGALLHAIMNASSQPDAAVVSVAVDAKGIPLNQEVAITALRIVTDAADVAGESDIQTSLELAGDGIPAMLKIKTEDGEIIELPVVLMVNAAGSDIATLESSLEFSPQQATGGVTGSPMGITIVIPAADSGSEGTTTLTADSEILAESALQGGLHQAAQHTPPLAAGITPGSAHRITVPIKPESFAPETVRRTPEQVTDGASVITPTTKADTGNQQPAPISITFNNTTATGKVANAVTNGVYSEAFISSPEQAAVQLSQVTANAPVSASSQTVGIQASSEMPVTLHITDSKPVPAGNAGISIILPDIPAEDIPAGEASTLQRVIDLITGNESASAIEIEISGALESVHPERGLSTSNPQVILQIPVDATDTGTKITGIETGTARLEPVQQTPVQQPDTPEMVSKPVNADQPAHVSAASVSSDFNETSISAPVIDEPVNQNNAESRPASDTIQTSIKPEASSTATSEIQVVREPVPVHDGVSIPDAQSSRIRPVNPESANVEAEPVRQVTIEGATASAESESRGVSQVIQAEAGDSTLSAKRAVARTTPVAPAESRMAVSERTANNQPVTVPRENTPDTVVPQETVRIVAGNQEAPETPAVTNDSQHLQATAEPVSDVRSVRVKPAIVATNGVSAVTNESAPEHVSADTVNDAAVTDEPALPSTEQRIDPEQTVISGEHTTPEETVPISLRSRAITPVYKDGVIAVKSTETSPVETGNIIDADIPAVQNNDGSRDAKEAATRPAAHHYISGAPETDKPAVTRQTTDTRPHFINHHDSPTRRVQHMSGASGGQENNMQPSQQQSVAPDQAMNGSMTGGAQGFESLIAAAASTDGRNVVLQDTSDASSSLDGIDPVPGTGGMSSEAITSKVKTADKSGEARFANLSPERQEQVFSTIVRYARIMVHEGKSTATIRLEPPSLGRVRLEISTENARVTGKIVVEKAEVRDIVKHHLPELRDSLAQNGLKVESFDVQVGHNGGTDNWARRQMMENQRGQGIREPLPKNAPQASGTAEITRSQPNRLIRNGIVDIRI